MSGKKNRMLGPGRQVVWTGPRPWVDTTRRCDPSVVSDSPGIATALTSDLPSLPHIKGQAITCRLPTKISPEPLSSSHQADTKLGPRRRGESTTSAPHGEETTNHCHEPTANQPSQRDQPPHTTAKVQPVKKRGPKKAEHTEGTRLRYPPHAVSSQCVELGVEPVLKQYDLHTSGPKKKKGKGREGQPNRWWDGL